MKKTIISALVMSVLLSGCGSDDKQTTDNATPLDVQTTFSARYIQTLPAKSDRATVYTSEQASVAERAEQTSQVRYLGKLEVTNVENNEEQVFDWPVTQTVDAEGNVTTTSHRALTLKPGTYDFALLLTTEGANPKQYLAKALGHEVMDGEQPAIEFIVEPNLGDTITDFDDIDYVSKLAFQWQAEELAALNKPQFGLSVNGGEEQVFEINKETGLAEITMNVEPGEYTLSLRLYDGDLMVGKNEDDATVNFVEGEDAQTDIIPLQADVIFEVAEIKDRGNFSFAIPEVLIEEVGGVENLTLKASINAQGIAPQERVLDILDVNGTHIAQDMFETGGAKELGLHLEFYNTNASQDLADLTPFTRCNTTVTVEANQTLGCKLELKRESIITNRILGTLRINALNENWTPAEGADVFLNGEKVGVTGSEIGAGTFKTHLVAGEYQVSVKQGENVAHDDITLLPLDVKNMQVALAVDPDIGTGNFVHSATYQTGASISGVAVGDLNEDGYPDVVLTNKDTNKGLLIYFGDKTGTLGAPTQVKTPHGTTDVTLADINGDNTPDLIVMGWGNNDNALTQNLIFKNTGKGQFERFQVLSETPGNVSYNNAAFIDIDRDGSPEIIATEGKSNVGIYKKDNAGFFQLSTSYPNAKSREFAVGDLNNDGYPDIVTDKVLLNDKQGGFNVASETGAGHYVSQQLADFNNDSYLDLLTNGQNGMDLFLNDGTGHFKKEMSFPGQSHYSVIIGDVNNDGYPDIASNNRIWSDNNSSTEQLKLFTNSPGLVFKESEIENPEQMSPSIMADLDKDGDNDMIVSTSGRFAVFKNTPAQ
ncbi:FG-GAP repeat domain-containing protein [Enterovibrio norvegicus]|uniref:FG-GAP repeat domain-containing protein n=1 Tax=Enterovibrio norvegicus TaxID=188144 RepID=UPI0024B13632|nr:VCBS repeat-containing protein [Enterovibrio norvegicus]